MSNYRDFLTENCEDITPKRSFKGIEFTIEGSNVCFTYENEDFKVPLKFGISASKTMWDFICKHKRLSKVTVISYQNNNFGSYWKNCWMGQFMVENIDDQLWLYVKYDIYEVKLECYKHPFHLASSILRGRHKDIVKTIIQIKKFQENQLKGGIDYKITPKGIFLIR